MFGTLNACEVNGLGDYLCGDLITLEAYNFLYGQGFAYWSNEKDTVRWDTNPLEVYLNDEIIDNCLNSEGYIYFVVATKDVLPKYTITTACYPKGAGATSGGGTYYEGMTTTISVLSINRSYRFVMWNDGVTDTTREVTFTEDTTYTAIFKLINILADTTQSSGVLADTVEPFEMIADTTKVYG
jgi:hypothetical protein